MHILLTSATELPAAVTQPFNQLLGWIMWLLCLSGIARLLVIGGQMGHAREHGHDAPDTPVGVFIGLIVATSAAGIAAALVSF